MAENGSVGFPPPDDAESVFMICGICKKTPSEASGPKLLPCLHTFCEECLSNKFRQQQSEKLASSVVPSTSNSTQAQVLPRLKCPTCGQEFLVLPKEFVAFSITSFSWRHKRSRVAALKLPKSMFVHHVKTTVLRLRTV